MQASIDDQIQIKTNCFTLLFSLVLHLSGYFINEKNTSESEAVHSV